MSNSTITAGTGDTLTVNGQYDAVNASGDAITLGGSAIATVNGDNDTITHNSSEWLAINGGGEVINVAGGGTVVLGTGSTAGMTARIVASGTGIVAGSAPATSYNATIIGNNALVEAGGDTLTVGDNVQLTVWGSHNTITAGTGDTLTTTDGGQNTITLNGTSTLTDNGQYDVINASGSAITLGGSGIATLNGNDDTIADNSTPSLWLSINGSGEVIDVLAGGTVILGNGATAGMTARIVASGTGIVAGSAPATSYNATIIGNNALVEASGDTLTVGDNVQTTISGNGNTITTGTGDTLTLNGSNNTVVAGSGVSLTLAGAGNVAKLGADVGQDVITNTTGAASGEIDFGAGISDQNLWFQQSGNDLQIDLLGTNQKVTVANWFANPAAQVAQIDTADGMKLDSGVAQLVSAMATYSANNPGFNPATASQAPNDANLQGAIAAAWHH
jgi:hypothetical protein